LASDSFRLFSKAWEKTAAYCRQAAHKADARSALHEAVTYFDQALDAISHLPDSAETRVRAIDLRLELCTRLLALGDVDRILTDLTTAQTLAASLDDRPRLGRVLALMANFLSRSPGDCRQAVRYGERALALADEFDDRELKVRASFESLGQICSALGEYDRAIACLRRTLALISEEMLGVRYGLLAPASVGAFYYLIWSLTERGEFEEAEILLAKLQGISETTGRTIDTAWAYLSDGYIQILMLQAQRLSWLSEGYLLAGQGGGGAGTG
jgi:tetratricopeptide (TPR) repeat protein